MAGKECRETVAVVWNEVDMLKCEIEKVLIAPETSVRVALQRLCETGYQTLFVAEAESVPTASSSTSSGMYTKHPYIVAEIGRNHNGDIELGKRMIRPAMSRSGHADYFSTDF